MNKFDKLFFLFVFFVLCFSIALFSADRVTGKMFATRSEVIANHGMVATSQPLAAQIGIDILKKGGNAVDAAIAVNAALGLMEPTSNGIGGDLFAIVWDSKTKKLYGLNSSGPSPKALTLAYFKKKGLKRVPYYGPLPWSVPGCVDGWFELHKKFGKLPMKTILTPAISYAKGGFPLSELISYYWQVSVKRHKKYENFQKLYAPGGKLLQKGDIFKNPELAKTLALIAKKGRDAFYKGEIARTIVKYSERVGGFFQYEDFADYQAEWVQPLAANYKGYDVWELPPNGQGIAVLQMLNMLKNIDMKSMGHNSAQYLHTLIEVKKIVYEDRARFYADQKFVKLPLKKLLSPEYAEERLQLFNPEKALREIPYNDAKIEKGDTIYLTVVDKDGNAVSLIQSNYAGFGSGMVPDGLGFCLQDRGALFSLEEGHLNVLEPGKRPFHTIIPAMVTKDGKPVFSFGVMGGAMQPQGHVQVLLNILEFDMNIQEAGDAPRFRHTGSSQPDYGVMKDGGTVYLEAGISAQVIKDLLLKGHNISKTRGGFGGYQGIWIDAERGILIGASESRKDGCAIGY
ncbi:MAG: gamma-glutamyltransferase [Candidatus Aminicenantes bacterium]|nr:gamma-glutamyltransferase [Candidatus Aminicenantes bacterium]